MYLPEKLVGDIFVADTRVSSEFERVYHVRRDTGFYFSHMHTRSGRCFQEVSVHDDQPAPVHCETPAQINTTGLFATKLNFYRPNF